MAQNLLAVPIGGMVVSTNPDDVLVAYGLGSCVAICMYDPLAKIGGMVHALLPVAPDASRAARHPAKFVTQAVPLLVDSLLDKGARRFRLAASICGGAKMLSGPSFNGRFDIGKLNVQAAEAALQSARVWLRASATGGRHGRTVRLYLCNGQVTVKSLDQNEHVLANF